MVHFYQGYMVYQLDLKRNLILTRWTRNLIGEEYRQAMLFIIDAIETHKLEYWLYDSSRYSSPDISDQHWMADVFTPLMKKTSIKKVAALLPVDTFQQIAVENIQKRLANTKQRHLAFELFIDIADAQDWLFSSE